MIERYNFIPEATHSAACMESDEKGSWVLYSDYEALERENAKLRAEVERLTPLAVAYDYLEAPDAAPPAVPEGCADVGQQVVKIKGYPFPGEIRSVFKTRAGLVRYVVEATGADYAGMLHIFSPEQITAAQEGR